MSQTIFLIFFWARIYLSCFIGPMTTALSNDMSILPFLPTLNNTQGWWPALGYESDDSNY